jgi:hypothetical protein
MVFTASCGGESGSLLGPPATVEILDGAAQITPIGSPVTTPPRIRVKDFVGAALPGVSIRFTVVAGGGSVTPSLVVTGADGTATVESWTVGPTPGTNTLEARVEGGTVSNTVSVTGVISSPTTVAVVGTVNFVAPAGQSLPTLPVVEVRDGFGNVQNGAQVTFTVISGGGTVDGAVVLTNAQGRATLGAWTLGPTAGTNVVRARLANEEFVDFTAQGLAAALATLEPVSPTDQTGTLGFQVTTLPRVRVKDALGNAVPNIPVAFALTGFGDATLSGAIGISDANGIASPQDWKMGRVNASSTLQATIPGFPGPMAEFRATATPRAFVIDLRLLSTMTANQRDAFVVSAQRWMDIITGDVPDLNVNRPVGDCGAGSPAVSEFVDDVIIFASVVNIDGPGGILGSAGPCTIRFSTALPVIGRMRFDAADLISVESGNQLIPLILHEMGHVLGFGTIWEDLGLSQDQLTNDPIFVGTNALTLWPTLTLGYIGRPVPLENTGGGGTASAHWRETVFNAELMTGFIESPGVPMPLSRMTIASMRDLGYTVNYDASDSFAGSLTAMLRQLNSTPRPINEVLVYPTTRISPTGVVTPIARP